MNQNGALSGAATISTSGTSTISHLEINGTGSLALADDLNLTNTSGSILNTGELRISVPITGTGNVTINNSKTSLTRVSSTISLAASNSFTGNVLVQRGTVNASNANSFGNSSNVVTLGAAGQGNASIFFNTSGAPPIVSSSPPAPAAPTCSPRWAPA